MINLLKARKISLPDNVITVIDINDASDGQVLVASSRRLACWHQSYPMLLWAHLLEIMDCNTAGVGNHRTLDTASILWKKVADCSITSLRSVCIFPNSSSIVAIIITHVEPRNCTRWDNYARPCARRRQLIHSTVIISKMTKITWETDQQ